MSRIDTVHETEQRIPIQAHVGDERRTEGYVSVVLFTLARRLREAVKKVTLFWAASLLSVFIPVFHFFTVPLFFLLGIFFAFRSYKSEGRVTAGLTTCPHCKQEVPIKPAELRWPVTEICQSCARVIRMDQK